MQLNKSCIVKATFGVSHSLLFSLPRLTVASSPPPPPSAHIPHALSSIIHAGLARGGGGRRRLPKEVRLRVHVFRLSHRTHVSWCLERERPRGAVGGCRKHQRILARLFGKNASVWCLERDLEELLEAAGSTKAM